MKDNVLNAEIQKLAKTISLNRFFANIKAIATNAFFIKKKSAIL